VFEVSGSASGLQQACAIAPRGARIVAVGVQKAPPAVDMRRLTLDELELIGTVAHVCAEDLPEALRLLAARASGWTDMAPDVLPLHDLMADGILPLAEGRATRIKTLIDPWAQARRAVR
jgi:threonine dehydrogenase-like Zn-dependent dehydrogenase